METHMQPLPTLDKILSTLTETDCIETLSINLCGTIDDTSHNITYKKNRKHAGTLTLISKTTNPDMYMHEYKNIYGHSLVINDIDYFNSLVMNYLSECASDTVYSCDSAIDIWFELYVRFSNKQTIKQVINTPQCVALMEELYNCLEQYPAHKQKG